jgi:hypothetical protein
MASPPLDLLLAPYMYAIRRWISRKKNLVNSVRRPVLLVILFFISQFFNLCARFATVSAQAHELAIWYRFRYQIVSSCACACVYASLRSLSPFFFSFLSSLFRLILQPPQWSKSQSSEQDCSHFMDNRVRCEAALWRGSTPTINLGPAGVHAHSVSLQNSDSRHRITKDAGILEWEEHRSPLHARPTNP